MKLLIASDIHGSAVFCQALMRAWDRERADRLLLLGDLLYHGPRNDLPEGYDPRRTAEMLNQRRDGILCVRGNCDAEVDQMMLRFPILAEYALLSLSGAALYACHGHALGPDSPPPLRRGDVLLYGHTHVPAWEDRDGCLWLNPGSVSIPKNGSARSYMTFENGVFTWKTLAGDAFHRLAL